MPDTVPAPQNNNLMRLFLLFVALLLVPIALNYGLHPSTTLPMSLDIQVSGTDQTHIYRGVMCLYLGTALFFAIGAFTPSWQRVAVIYAIVFAASIAVGRVISLVVDGWPSPLLLIYLATEIVGSLLGFAVLAAADRDVRR